MNRIPRVLSVCLLLGSAGLYGCAGHKDSGQALQQASADFQKVKEDTDVLRSAPKDVIRAVSRWPAPSVCPVTWGAAPMLLTTPTSAAVIAKSRVSTAT